MFSADNIMPDLDAVSDWLEIAHTRIEEAFEAAFTDKTHREVFKEVRA